MLLDMQAWYVVERRGGAPRATKYAAATATVAQLGTLSLTDRTQLSVPRQVWVRSSGQAL